MLCANPPYFVCLLLGGLLWLPVAPALGQTSFGPQDTIDTHASGAIAVFAADLDGDGDPDVLSSPLYDKSVVWYENLGGGNFGPPDTVATHVGGARDIYAADLDGDGDKDVLIASSTISWFENQGGGSFGPQQVIYKQNSAFRGVHAADLDGDGDKDVISAATNTNEIAWHENQNSGSNWVFDTVTMKANTPVDVYTADMDGDGDPDVLSASEFDDKIAWYKNNGGNFDSLRVISTSANGPFSVHAADLDGDGDPDVLSASWLDDKIAWYENQSLGRYSTANVINKPDPDANSFNNTNGNADGAYDVFAKDLDGDGDPDVLSASFHDDKIAWYENLGGGQFGPQQVINTPARDTTGNGVYDINGNANWASSTFATDLDGDGEADVLSSSLKDNKIAWYENLGCPDFEAFAQQVSPIRCKGDHDAKARVDSVAAGTQPYSYTWGNGATTPTTDSLGPGTTTVIVSEAEGCRDTDSVAITAPALLQATATVDSNVSCHGLSDGGASVTAWGGTPPYAYTWNNGATTSAINNLGAGSVSVIVADANSCSDTDSVTITAPAALHATTSTQPDTGGRGVGSASIAVSGGAPPYHYGWSNGDTGATITGLPVGEYIVTVTDSNGCSLKDTVTVSDVTGREGASTTPEALALRLRPNPTTGPLTLEGPFSPAKPGLLRVLDATGRLVRRQHLTAKQNSLRLDVPAGLYNISVRQGERRAYRKIIVR